MNTVMMIIELTVAVAVGFTFGAMWGLSQHRALLDWLQARTIRRWMAAMQSLGYEQEDIDAVLERMGSKIMPPYIPAPTHVLLSNHDFERKLNTLHDDADTIRKYFTEILQEEYPAFQYKGHGANIGLWETEDFQDLCKPRGNGFWSAKIRIHLFLPTEYGFDTHVEMMLNSVCEWETAYEGYIHSVRDILHILDFQLGIKK